MRYADSNCRCTETFENGEQLYTFTGKCVNSGETVSVTVKGPDLFSYRQGALIQNAFPYLSPEEREFLITGIYSGWDAMFDEEADEDYDEYEDDGQPTEYEEWQDYMGGDDWDQGQYDEY